MMTTQRTRTSHLAMLLIWLLMLLFYVIVMNKQFIQPSIVASLPILAAVLMASKEWHEAVH